MLGIGRNNTDRNASRLLNITFIYLLVAVVIIVVVVAVVVVAAAFYIFFMVMVIAVSYTHLTLPTNREV